MDEWIDRLTDNAYDYSNRGVLKEEFFNFLDRLSEKERIDVLIEIGNDTLLYPLVSDY